MNAPHRETAGSIPWIASAGAPGPASHNAVYLLFAAGVGLVAIAKAAEFAIFGNVSIEFDAWSFLGIFAAQVLYDSSVTAVRVGLLLGLAVTLALLNVFPSLSINAPALGLGIGSTVPLLARLGVRGQRGQMSFILALGFLMPLAHQICLFSQRMTTLHADTFDHRAFLVDASLGFNPAALFKHVDLFGFFPSALVIGTVYTSITFMMSVIVLWKIRIADRSWVQALAAFTLAGAVGTVLYHFFPVAGPVYAFPLDIPDPRTITSAPAFLDLNVVRNGVPSLHTGWAFLIMLNATGLPRWFRRFTVFYFAATLLATLATGQHYVVDLIVALPFAVAVQAATLQFWNGKGLYAPFWFGTLGTATWLVLLRDHVGLFLNTPGFTAVCMGGTIAATVLATRKVVPEFLIPEGQAARGRLSA